MTNPAPRPALRKAEDSSVHPAAPVRPARRRTPSSGDTGTTPAGAPSAGHPVEKVAPARPGSAEPKPARSRSSATAAPAEPLPPASQPGGASGGGAKGRRKPGKGRAFSGATSDHLRPDAVAAAAETAARSRKKKAQAFTDVDLMRGKTVELDVRVPKRLRKAAREEATRRGLDLDAVTTELLHRWLTGR